MNTTHGSHDSAAGPLGTGPGATSSQPPHDEPPHYTPPRPGPPPHTQSSRFFDQLRGLGVTRTSDRWIAGVCGGVARRLNVDPLLIRAAMVAALFLGIGFLAYLIAWALLPDESDTILTEKAIREGDARGIVLLIVIAVAIFGTGPWFGNDRLAGGVAVLGIAIAGWWVFTRHKRTRPTGPGAAPTSSPGPTGTPAAGQPFSPQSAPTTPVHTQAGPEPVWATRGPAVVGYEPPPADEQSRTTGYARAAQASPPPPPRKAKGAGFAGFLLVLGATVLGYGLGMAFGDGLGGPTGVIALMFATGAAGLSTLLLGLLGRRSVMSSMLSVLLTIALLSAWGIGRVPQGGFGDTVWSPSTSSLSSEYSWGFGSADLDLRGLATPLDVEEVHATMSFGELVIFVPDDVPTRIRTSAVFGSIEVVDPDGETQRVQGGTSVGSELLFGTDDGNQAELTINANVRFGSLRIVTTAPVTTG
ncbi:MAG: PspC domain-containing protein [Tetrasphaera sp.]|nr:PspC domain-containing protein [Tetrasphaera sp.]